MSDIADAIARAQRDVEHDCRYVMPGKCEPCDNLAALGPPSVALAMALEAWAEWELTLEGVDYQITPPNDLGAVKKLGRKALQDWADAQQGGAGGA